MNDRDLEIFIPQYAATLDILRMHRLMWPLEELAAHVTLKVIAITGGQVKEALMSFREVARDELRVQQEEMPLQGMPGMECRI